MKSKVVDFLYDKLIEDKPIGKIDKEEKIEYLKGYVLMGIIITFMSLLPFFILGIL
jgi:hypothetical protein